MLQSYRELLGFLHEVGRHCGPAVDSSKPARAGHDPQRRRRAGGRAMATAR